MWGSFRGSSAEPYDTVVDHVTVGVQLHVPEPAGAVQARAGAVAAVDRRARPRRRRARPRHVVARAAPGGRRPPRRRPADRPGRRRPSDPATRRRRGRRPGRSTATNTTCRRRPIDRPDGRDDRVARMYDGLDELDRWLVDRMRTGLADPALARYATWDALAARLVDARAGSLANRVRRLAGLVGASPDWHERVLDEIGLLHLLSQAGRRLGTLPGRPRRPGGDHDRLAGPPGTTCSPAFPTPTTGSWPGRSDTREDRIEVRRTGCAAPPPTGGPLVLSFAAYRQSLDDVARGRHDDPRRPPPLSRPRPPRPSSANRYGDARPQPAASAAFSGRSWMLCEEVGADAGGRAVARPGAGARAGGADRCRPGAGCSPTTAGRSRSTTAIAIGDVRARRCCSPCRRAVRSISPSSGRRPVSCRSRCSATATAVDIGPRADPSFVGGGIGSTDIDRARRADRRRALGTARHRGPARHRSARSAGDRRADRRPRGRRDGAEPAERMLVEVAAATAVRRAAFVPRDPPAPTAAARGTTRVRSVRRRRVDAGATSSRRGRCSRTNGRSRSSSAAGGPTREIVPAMLARHRTRPGAAGRTWWSRPARSPSGSSNTSSRCGRATAAARPRPRTHRSSLPVLPVPPDLAELAGEPGERIGEVLADALVDRRPRHGPSHRAREHARPRRPDGLGAIADELERVSAVDERPTGSPPSLADLARTARAPCSTNSAVRAARSVGSHPDDRSSEAVTERGERIDDVLRPHAEAQFASELDGTRRRRRSASARRAGGCRRGRSSGT